MVIKWMEIAPAVGFTVTSIRRHNSNPKCTRNIFPKSFLPALVIPWVLSRVQYGKCAEGVIFFSRCKLVLNSCLQELKPGDSFKKNFKNRRTDIIFCNYFLHQTNHINGDEHDDITQPIPRVRHRLIHQRLSDHDEFTTCMK